MQRLLYIEDNEDNLYMLTLFFDVQGGYEILSAATGAEGIASAIAAFIDEAAQSLDCHFG